MANSNTNIDLIAVNQAQKESVVNALIDAVSPSSAFGRHDSACVGLTWGYYAGVVPVADVPTEIANGTIALTASVTNYLYRTAAGVVTKVTSAPSGWPGPLLAGAVALYEVVTGAATVTSYADKRLAAGTRGATGAPGGAVAFAWTFSATTTDADPGNGILRLNNATQSSATLAYIDLLDADGSTLTAVLDSLDDAGATIKGYVRLAVATDPTKWLLFSSGAVTSASGYRKLALTYISGSAASPFTAADRLLLSFVAAGAQGATGATGPAWTPVANTVAYAASLTLNAAAYDIYDITLTGPLTLDFSNGVDGKQVVVRLKQDGTGSRILTLGTTCRLGSDIPTVVLSITANLTDYLMVRYNAAAVKYDVLALNRGF